MAFRISSFEGACERVFLDLDPVLSRPNTDSMVNLKFATHNTLTPASVETDRHHKWKGKIYKF